MGQHQSSVVRQRRLRVGLRRIREQAGRTQKAVADDLGWSTAKMIRIETGKTNVSPSDLRALLHYYGINDSSLAEDLVAVTRIREEGWWAEYRSYFSQQFLNFLGYEDSAIRIREYMRSVVPGLLQTEEYARALIVDYQKDEEQLDRGVCIRMRRQSLLDRANCPELLFILDEAVVHRWVGGASVMGPQLVRLKQLARHPRISIRIVPFTKGMYAGMQGSSFTIYDFASEDGVATLLEEPRRDLILDDSEASTNYIRIFSMLQRIACSEGEVDRFIDPMIDRMRVGVA